VSPPRNNSANKRTVPVERKSDPKRGGGVKVASFDSCIETIWHLTELRENEGVETCNIVMLYELSPGVRQIDEDSCQVKKPQDASL